MSEQEMIEDTARRIFAQHVAYLERETAYIVYRYRGPAWPVAEPITKELGQLYENIYARLVADEAQDKGIDAQRLRAAVLNLITIGHLAAKVRQMHRGLDPQDPADLDVVENTIDETVLAAYWARGLEPPQEGPAV